MKYFRVFLAVLISVSILSTGCSRKWHPSKKVYKVKPLPPGHAKKITGSKSAKPYAPGQQKKINKKKGNGRSRS